MSNLKTLTLRDVCQATQGVQIPKSSQSKIPKKNFKRYFYISDFTHDKNLKYVEDKYPKKNFTCEDIIVSNTGSHGEVFIGKEGILSNNLFKVTFDKEIINGSFLVLFLKSNLFKDFQLKRVKGTANPHMGHENFFDTPIILPPLPVQQKIVAKLDKIFSEIDKAVAAAEANVKNANLLIKASVDQLINNFNKNCYVKFGDTCNFVRGPFGGSLKKSIFVDKGYAVYEQQHPINNQFDSFRYFITKDKFNEMKRFEVFPNDLIMSCSGTLGKIAIVPKDAPKGIINQALLKISTKNIIRNTFLKIILESNNFQSILWNLSGGTAQPNVPSVKIIKDFLIPLPTLNEQDEFINNVSKIISYNLNFIYNKKRNSLLSLKKSILTHAFNGKLVKAA